MGTSSKDLRPSWLLATALFLLLGGYDTRPAPEDVLQLPPLDGLEGQPIDLQATGATQKSIALKWDLAIETFQVEGYRIYYQHDAFKDVKTVKDLDEQTSYVLRGLEPFTEYEIWIESIINGTASPESNHIFAKTDVEEPSAPAITNASCYGTGMVYVEWARPIR